MAFDQSVGNIRLMSLPGLDRSQCSSAVFPKRLRIYGFYHRALTETSKLCSKCCHFQFQIWNAQLLDRCHFRFADHISGCGKSIGLVVYKNTMEAIAFIEASVNL